MTPVNENNVWLRTFAVLLVLTYTNDSMIRNVQQEQG